MLGGLQLAADSEKGAESASRARLARAVGRPVTRPVDSGWLLVGVTAGGIPAVGGHRLTPPPTAASAVPGGSGDCGSRLDLQMVAECKPPAASETAERSESRSHMTGGVWLWAESLSQTAAGVTLGCESGLCCAWAAD